MMTLTRSLFATRSLTLCALLGAGLTVANAQQTAPAADSTQPQAYSSSSDNNLLALTENPFEKFVSADAAQGPRRTYGRPRYRGSNQNADGSNKWAFEIGGGFTAPLGNTSKYNNLSYGFTVGAGRNFNKNFGVLINYDYDRMGLTRLGNQLALYNQVLFYYNQQATQANQATYFSSLDGNTHIHSVSINPTFSMSPRDGIGAYVSIGAGYYHKVTDFTVPTIGTYCDYYYGCYQYQANQIVDHYFSNAPGFSAGVGLTYKLGRWTGAKFFVEGKYVYLVTSQRYGLSNASQVNATNWTALNDYPANSNRTSYVPVKMGIRF